MILIIGASSFIGRKLYDYFSSVGILTTGTYYNTPSKGLVYFDLQQPDLSKLDIDLDKIRHVVICSGITNMDMCKVDMQHSFRVNVEGVKNLIRQAFERGIFPIFISSDYVFDGAIGNYDEQNPPSPNMEYGKQKMYVEKILSRSNEPCMIARFSRVFGVEPGDNTILTRWVEQLQNGELIRCAVDQIFSLTYIGDVVRALELCIKKGLHGCYNIASLEKFSRYELAALLKSSLGINTGEVLPCSINDFQFADNRPLNTSLNPAKFMRATNFRFTPLKECLKTLKLCYKLN